MQRLFLLFLILTIFLTIACTSNEAEVQGIDESKIKIKVTHQFESDYFVGYAITITNNTKETISYLDMYLRFPSKKEHDTNRFILVGLPQKENAHLKSGESLEFTFEGFLEIININELDIKNPEVELNGYVDEVPFVISRQFKVLKSDSK